MNTCALTEDGFERIAERFCQFYDAVVDEIVVGFEPKQKVTCTLLAKDNDSESGWTKVVFELIDFTELKFCYGRQTFAVLSSGLQIFWKDGLVHFFIDAYPDDPGMPDKKKNCAFVVSHSVRLSILN